MSEEQEKEGRDMGRLVENQSSSSPHKPARKRGKKPANRALPTHGRKRATDAEVATAIVAAGGRIGKAAEVLGKSSHAIRKRTTLDAPNPELRGLPRKVQLEMRRLVREGVTAKLLEGDVRVLIEVMHSKLCRDMGLAPDKQEVELSGKVDGDLRLGVLDERAAAARLKALEEAR